MRKNKGGFYVNQRNGMKRSIALILEFHYWTELVSERERERGYVCVCVKRREKEYIDRREKEKERVERREKRERQRKRIDGENEGVERLEE